MPDVASANDERAQPTVETGDRTEPSVERTGDEAELARRLRWAKLAIAGAALVFLGFAVGLVVARDRAPGRDSVDVGFLQDMITHHEQALSVATLVVANGQDPTVRSYAREILTFQGYEIGIMTEMLDDGGYTPNNRPDEAMAWMDMAVPVERMPGLLSDEQMDQLKQVRGAQLDALFLDEMAEHHRGGLHMATDAARQAGDDDVRKLAARIARTQASEINEYRAVAERNGYTIDIPPASVPADIAEAGETGGG